MPIEAVNQTTEGHVHILYGNDDLNVGAGVTIRSTLTDAVTTWSGQHRITIAGTVMGFDDGINTIGVDPAQTVEIAASGRIETANDGSIVDADGVILDGVGSVLTNLGTIAAQGSAASLFVRDAGTTTVTNAGLMTGIVAGVWNKFGSGVLNFTNTGTVESPNFAFRGGLGSDNVFNQGTLKGTVDLGEGNDLYDGRGGKVIGNILGGAGDDRFVLGNGIERIDGGAGHDALDFSGFAAGIAINITAGARNANLAVKGDTFAGIEEVIGSAFRDNLTGDAQANTLRGGAERDILNGGAGDDLLDGGAGRDRLTGGAGADGFVFATAAGFGDAILDFDALVDTILLAGAAVGMGGITGAVAATDFVTGTTNATQDASDRFVFRTTDQTLWFDADGLGGVKSVLVCDLQTGATLTAADLLII
ncbi:MAG: hypothetical protein MUD11_10300 [Rhodobacteraceae bacterium]|nr:hypothetical protein [Paracoccaceae bacterium]